jgi:hypothetical protein
MELQPSELEALGNSASLLKFAAENVKDAKELPKELVSTLATAWKQREEEKWDPDISTKFWRAYTTLCTLIKPVSLDSLMTTQKQAHAKRWFLFGADIEVSVADRSARRYLFFMLGLLWISLHLGFITSTTTNLSSEMQKLIDESSVVAADIRAQIDSLWPAFGSADSLDGAKDEETRKKVSLLRSRLQELYYLTDRIYQKSDALSIVLYQMSFPYLKGDLTLLPNLSDANQNLTNYYLSRREMSDRQQKASILANMMASYILPVILGALGSCAYVIRFISDQINNSTYSRASSIRHLVRVALGALAGVAIGYGGFVAGTGVSGAALSFIAGYAIEPVFATFDSIAQKFR